ncbi:MAG: FAD binding domain-containing protein [Deltaproteobacteria bacterium]|nr:FAD binding domain-containing protein [Deltaproteobacteria bacterium]
MKSFDHYDAHSVMEALSIIRDYRGKARLMAGGTDLLGILKDDILSEYPEAIINIKTVPGLNKILEDKDGLKIGAMTRLVEIINSPLINSKYPLLADAAKSVATPEIRNMATIGGNLCQDSRCWYYRYPHQIGGRILCYRKGKGPCHAIKGDNRYHAIIGGKKCFAVCPSDMGTALTALDATVVVSGHDGERILPVQDFFDVMGPRIGPDEILTEIRIKEPPSIAFQSFIKFRLRETIDFAIVSVASVITKELDLCKDARIVLGAVAPVPYRATMAEEVLKGKPLDRSVVDEAAKAAVKDAKPLSGNAYKVEIAKSLVRRSILPGES